MTFIQVYSPVIIILRSAAGAECVNADDATLEAAGGDVEFSGGGQAGLAISLAVRCRGAGEAAHISATVTHPANGTSATRHERTLPDPLACQDDGWCTLLPVRIGVGRLGEPGEVDGADVTIEAAVRAPDGRRATVMTTGVLRRR